MNSEPTPKAMSGGPLHGKRVVEFGAIGPAPFCGMLLADLGADVVRIEAMTPPRSMSAVPCLNTRFDVVNRGKRSMRLDLKRDEDRSRALSLVVHADALIEGFRPGVMERLGLGPDVCCALNRRLVYGRMTGWGQTGPLAQMAGHDINYIALSGALHSIGTDGGSPTIPLNLIGDYAGGGLMLALGLVSAMLETTSSGKGQVVDAAMSEGAAALMAAIYGLRGAGLMPNMRGRNILDGGAHFYAIYECSDGQWLAVGALEPEFYAELIRCCGVEDPQFERQLDPASWPVLKSKLAAIFRTRTRAQWQELLETRNACVAPVLSMEEAPHHPQNRARQAFIVIDGVTQPAPAPRFDRSPAQVRWGAPAKPVDYSTILSEWDTAG